ncbi:MAG TPA: hypothetical protein VMS96_05775 [Terriglobales bacterium]|nr:hypothetical protein [Terriglobales bacterium]
MEPRSQPGPRVLLIEPQQSLRRARARRLLALGYQVSAVPAAELAPRAFPPGLYDVIVVGAHDSCPFPSDWYHRTGRADRKPVIVVLASGPFRLEATALPAIVISDQTEEAIEDKLLAFLSSVTQSAKEAS